MKEDFKNISLLLIPYLTICGSLYHLSYWDTFNVNGLAFISISDIIKSSVYPILSTVFFIFLGLVLGIYINPLESVLPSNRGKVTVKKMNFSIGKYLIIFLWIIVLMIIPDINDNPSRWTALGFIAVLPAAILVEISGKWSNVISDSKTRIVVFQILFYLPVFAFVTGKYNSEMIYRNLKYTYITINLASQPKQLFHNQDTMKLLGSSDKHFIFTDMTNIKTYFIKTENLDTLIFQDKK